MSPRASSSFPVVKRHLQPLASNLEAYRRPCYSRAHIQAGPTNERVVVVVSAGSLGLAF